MGHQPRGGGYQVKQDPFMVVFLLDAAIRPSNWIGYVACVIDVDEESSDSS